MKRLIFVFLFCNLFYLVSSQVNKHIELFDLIKIFLPDKSMDYNAYDWFTGTDDTVPINWKTKDLEWRNNTAFRFGEAIVTINNEYFECLGTKKEPCTWSIALQGSRAGYTSFSINSVTHPDIGIYVIDGLLHKGDFVSTLLKSCDKDPLSGFYFYKIEISGKKDFWLKYEWSCGANGNCSIIIDCYTEQREIDLNCWTE